MKRSDYFTHIQLRNIVLNSSSTELLKWPAPGAMPAYGVNEEISLHYSHDKDAVEVNNFTVTVELKANCYVWKNSSELGRNMPEVFKEEEFDKIFEIICKMSGFFVIKGEQKEKLARLEKEQAIFANQVYPYIRRFIDDAMTNMDLVQRGIRFPYLLHDLSTIADKKNPSQKGRPKTTLRRKSKT